MEIATMCLRGLGAGHWARLRRNGVAEPVMRGLVKNIGGMRLCLPDEPENSHSSPLHSPTKTFTSPSHFWSSGEMSTLAEKHLSTSSAILTLI